MKVVLEFTYDADIISIPDEKAVDDLKKYRNKFDEWLYDKNIDHPYWVYSNGKKECVAYRGDAFVFWLNEFVFKNCEKKAELLESEIDDYDKTLPSLWF